MTNRKAALVADLLAENLALVFCGTAPSAASFEQQAYYAHPGNKFYKALHQSGLTDIEFTPVQYPKLLSYGIGLTDLNKTQYGKDSDLRKSDFDVESLRQKILHHQPSWLAFTSKRAAQEFFQQKMIAYGEQSQMIGNTKIFVLSSPSGRASKYWDITVWQQLAQRVKFL